MLQQVYNTQEDALLILINGGFINYPVIYLTIMLLPISTENKKFNVKIWVISRWDITKFFPSIT